MAAGWRTVLLLVALTAAVGAGRGRQVHYHFTAASNGTGLVSARYWTWGNQVHVTAELGPGQVAHVTARLPRGASVDLLPALEKESSRQRGKRRRRPPPVRVTLDQLPDCPQPCPPGEMSAGERRPVLASPCRDVQLEVVEGPEAGALMSPGRHTARLLAVGPGGLPLAVCVVKFHVPPRLQSGCQSLPQPRHGEVTCEGSLCSYACHEGYVVPTSMLHLRRVECVAGRWNHTCPVACVPADPPRPAQPCRDVVLRSDVLPVPVPPPDFLGPSGRPAPHVSCSLGAVHSFRTPAENVCQAADWERRALALCRYSVTVLPLREECGNLTEQANGWLSCDGQRCNVTCQEGFEFSYELELLRRGYVECNGSSGRWDFQQRYGLAELPDCLGRLATTALRRLVTFQLAVPDCADYSALLDLMTVVRGKLPSLCPAGLNCRDVAFLCSDEKEKPALNVTWTLQATYRPVPGAGPAMLDVDLSPLMEEEFQNVTQQHGGELLPDSFDQLPLQLGCQTAGFAVDLVSHRCVECPSGSYEEMDQCHPCPLNHFQNTTGNTKCMPCPRGSVSGRGARHQSDCKVVSNMVLSRPGRHSTCKDCEISCPPPHFGPRCQYLPCKPSHQRHFCLNKATCVMRGPAISCLCRLGFTGRRCHRRQL